MPNWYKSHSLDSKTRFSNCRAGKHGEITTTSFTRKLEAKPNLRATSRLDTALRVSGNVDAGLDPRNQRINLEELPTISVPRSVIKIKQLLARLLEELRGVEKGDVRDFAQDAIHRYLATAEQPACGFSICAATLGLLCSNRDAWTSAEAPGAYPARIAASFRVLAGRSDVFAHKRGRTRPERGL